MSEKVPGPWPLVVGLIFLTPFGWIGLAIFFAGLSSVIGAIIPW